MDPLGLNLQGLNLGGGGDHAAPTAPKDQGQALLQLLQRAPGPAPTQHQPQPQPQPQPPQSMFSGGLWGDAARPLPGPPGPPWQQGLPPPGMPPPGMFGQRGPPPGFFPPPLQPPPPQQQQGMFAQPPPPQHSPLGGLPPGFYSMGQVPPPPHGQPPPNGGFSLFPQQPPQLHYPLPPVQQQQGGAGAAQPNGGIPAAPASLQELLASLSRGAAAGPPPLPAPAAAPLPAAMPAPAAEGGAAPARQHKPPQVREGRWVDVMDRSHDGRTPRCSMAALDASLASLAAGLMPSDQERAAWATAFAAVREVLQARWPDARVVLFGSAANGLAVRGGNDIDVCLELDAAGDDAAAKAEAVSEAGALLEAAGMADVLTLPRARVPVVKFCVPATGTKVDITVNNTLACINTKLLADYASVDPRLAQLVSVVKHWAKQRAVNDPYRGTLSSYCYVLMCIHLLQTRRPPVLPVLQALPPTFSRRVRDWPCDFFDDVGALRGFGGENGQGLAALVWAFFEYWAWRHNYANGVVSVRTGGVLTKDEKDWTRRIGTERHLLCVEDPFETSHDLGRTVDRQTRDVMRKEFLRAATLLRDSPDPMAQLFEPYRSSKGPAK
jgi:predicted nucleotidyltransferase